MTETRVPQSIIQDLIQPITQPIVGVPPIILPPAGAPGVGAVLFDGASHLEINTDLTGAADGKLITIAFGFRPTSLVNSEVIISDNNRFSMTIGTGKITVHGENSSGATILQWDTSGFSPVVGEYFYSKLSINMASPTTSHWYVDDVKREGTKQTFLDQNIDFTDGGWEIGRNAVTQGRFIDGDLFQMWLDLSHLDLDTLAERRKFIDSFGTPTDKGLTGQNPLGADPLIFCGGETDTFPTNKGTGSGFILVGTLTTSTSSPLPEVISGDLVTGDFTDGGISIHTAVTSTLRQQSDSPGASVPTGLANTGGDLFILDLTDALIYRMVEFTNIIASSFASIGPGGIGLTVVGTNLVEADRDIDDTAVHVGLTSSISDQYANQGTLTTGLTFKAGNLWDLDRSPKLVTEHTGTTSSLTGTTFVPPGTTSGTEDMANDGSDNCILTNHIDNDIRIQSGFTLTTSSSFAAPGTNIGGATVAL